MFDENGTTVSNEDEASVKINKTINGTDKENEFEITLDVAVKPSGDSALSLVLDVSGSMNTVVNGTTKTRLQILKENTKTLIENYATMGNGQRYLSIVIFGGVQSGGTWVGNSTVVFDWADVSNPTQMNAALAVIDSLTANGGTFTQGGLALARNLFELPLVVGIENKALILFTDGNPTHWSETNTTSTSSFIGLNGTGVENTINVDTGRSLAEAVALEIKAMGIDLYTLGYGLTEGSPPDIPDGSPIAPPILVFDDWLAFVASDPSKAFNANSEEDLADMMNAIKDGIATGIISGIVTDNMGDNIVLTLYGHPDVVGSGNGFTWTLQVSNATYIGGWYIWTYTYLITLNNLDPSFSPDAIYKTNKDAILTLQNNTQFVFKNPSVRGYFGNFTFKKVDENGTPLAGGKFRLVHKCDCGLHDIEWEATVVSDSNGVVRFINIPSGHQFILEELTAPTGYILNSSTFNVDVNYGVVNTSIINSEIVNIKTNETEPEPPKPDTPDTPTDPDTPNPSAVLGAHAEMEKTGVPAIAVILMVLSIFGACLYRKQ